MAEREVAVLLVAPASSDFGVNLISATPPSGTFTKLRSGQVSDVVARNPIQEEAMDITVPADIVAGAYGLTGTIESPLRKDSATKALFQSLMGEPETANTYTLTQTPYELALRITDEQANDGAGTTVYYTGVGMSSVEISLNVDEYAKCKWSWIGRRGITTTTAVNDSTTTFTDHPMLVFYNATLTLAGSSIKAKGVTLTIDRKFDKDYRYIGTQFLQGLYMNGMTTLGGSLTLGASEWEMLQQVIVGNATAGTQALDAAKTEFAGTLLNPTAGGSLVLTLRTPNGATTQVTITATNCIITDMNRSVQNRNMWEKSVNFQCALPTAAAFSVVFADS